MEKYMGIYNSLAEILGDDAVEKLYRNFNGQQITFPKRLYSKEYVISDTKDILDSKELKSKAVFYGYTERRLKQILKEYHSKDNNST